MTPPLLVGRDDVLTEFDESVLDGPGAPGRLSILTGARGVGKTVMLLELADHVLREGWVTISETATPGLVERLMHTVTRTLYELDGSSKPGRQITGFSLPGGGGLTFSERPAMVVQWREQMGRLLDVLERNGTGLLITVDEVHSAGREELRDLATTYQHLAGEDRDIALVMAGLPSAVSDLLNDDVLTFLRRANRVELHDVDLGDVSEALRTTIESEGRHITDSALVEATQATGGYPFMIQLVGYHVWRKADGDVIDDAAVAAGVPVARRRLGSLVHATALADLSDVDRTYLVAMAQDDGESSTSTVAQRLRSTPAYAGTYRLRLIDAGMIEPTRRGYVDFALPFLREYLREHAARYEMSSRVSDPGPTAN
ncbi:ATP-binding protein [Promicromonospora sp. NPDC023805]|uniref:ATP-binding protein n=1 Tax=Promicromonospora sp. NPDC023805 TaxID=3154696 RepID=UPI0033D6FDAF